MILFIFNATGCELNDDISAIDDKLTYYIISRFGKFHVHELIDIEFDTSTSAIVIIDIMKWDPKTEKWLAVKRHSVVYFRRDESTWNIVGNRD